MAVCLRRVFVRYRLLASENGLYELASTFCHVGPGHHPLVVHFDCTVLPMFVPDNTVKFNSGVNRKMSLKIRSIAIQLKHNIA